MGETSINLAQRRGQLKTSLIKFEKYLSSGKVSIEQIPFRIEKIEAVWSEFEVIQGAIELEEEINMEEQDIYREECEELFFRTLAKANKLIGRVSSSKVENREIKENQYSCQQSSCGQTNKFISHVKLAPISISVFTGEYSEWKPFYDLFSKLIHVNADLSDIQKFCYLRSSLSGEAANIIKSLETTANNYEIAWIMLKERYDNNKLIIQTHVKAIFELGMVHQESAVKIREFLDSLVCRISALKMLEEKPEEWGPMLMHLICTKLDRNTLSRWEAESPQDRIARVSEFITFLENRVKVLEASKNIYSRGNQQLGNQNMFIKQNKYRSAAVTTTQGLKCYVCELPHTIYRCPQFISLSIADRIKKAVALKLCKICLRRHSERCTARYCLKCSKPHNVLLHLDITLNQEIKVDNNTTNDNSVVSDNVSTSAIAAAQLHEQVLLSTVEAYAGNVKGGKEKCRILLDSGSQCNFISEYMVQSLRLRKSRVHHSVIGIGGTKKNITSAVTVVITSRISLFKIEVQCLVVPKITGFIPSNNIKSKYFIPEGIQLADPSFTVPQKIDLLLGAGHFFDVLCAGKIKPSEDGPIFQQTQFGWVIAGVVNPGCSQAYHSISYSAVIDHENQLENMLSKFWCLEEVGTAAPLTLEDKKCKEFFENTVKRDDVGRFMVYLPFKEGENYKLGESYEIAKKRFLNMERKLQKDEKLKEEYSKFMKEYEILGHMQKISEKKPIVGEHICYLPHHAVYNYNSTTTRLRVVFDASCKTSSGKSLNDVLLKGPVLQDDMIFILIRFRKHKVALTADIKKMYRQINLAPEHCEYQIILWRENPKMPIEIYKLTTVTYGMSPSSFLATACLRTLASQEENYYPSACSEIKNNFYMDDYLGGTDTIESAVQLRDDLICIFQRAGMSLCKWLSNKNTVVDDTVENKNNERAFESTITKILGLTWDPANDMFIFKINLNIYAESDLTKRKILSEVASIYDPLGLLGPVIIRAKLFIQSLWNIKLAWDEVLTDNISEDCEDWLNYRKSLLTLNNLKVPRKITCEKDISSIEIHGFSDASEKAYGGCIYLRCTDIDGKHSLRLICGKSKIAPLKVISIPRLELRAALLLARLSYNVMEKLKLNIIKKYFWTDSNIVLAWISSPSTNWKTFVAHRVGEIQNLSCPSEWAHVRSQDNPADLLSRGCEAKLMNEMQLWWQGPSWLSKDKTEWPSKNNGVIEISSNMLERKSTTKFIGNVIEEANLLDKFSSLNKILQMNVEGRSGRGRPKKRWKDSLEAI
ncbi:uncharacterized protein LOC126898049 [Daktulosphaira vitifoliae]|uniref:uncharacterized protein LOC126898049 n=1 Tax=Daktulosphaira vitifoliae TaxID=58002 RepID=UPI0021AA0A62|nr:uncharacterized protein LOC126898049 [Daktulosphaira vitifoliae]